MKKLVLLSTVLLILFLGLGLQYWINNRIDLSYVKKGEVIFNYGDISIYHTLPDEELDKVKEIFENKLMHKDHPSCGFSEDVSIKLNGSQTLCLACDGCPIVYWKEYDKYIKLTEKEITQLHELLKTHGFTFPCI